MSTASKQSTASAITRSSRQLVEHLNSLVTGQNLGALALLRRGLGRQPGEVPEIYAHVLPYLSFPETAMGLQRERVEDTALLVASLYALWYQGKAQARSVERVSLGAAFRQLRSATDSGSVEQRFVALLKTSRDRLPDHLRHGISLLKAKEIPLDWALLFGDLYSWSLGDRRTQQRWARDFWQYVKESERAEGDATAEQPAGEPDDD